MNTCFTIFKIEKSTVRILIECFCLCCNARKKESIPEESHKCEENPIEECFDERSDECCSVTSQVNYSEDSPGG